MKLRRIFAALAACAIAATSVISASAADALFTVKTSYDATGNDGKGAVALTGDGTGEDNAGGKYNWFKGDVDVTKIDKIVVTIESTGAKSIQYRFGANNSAGKWSQEAKTVDSKTTTIEWAGIGGLSVMDGGIVKFGFDYIEPEVTEWDPEVEGKLNSCGEAVVKVTAIKYYDKDGKELAAAGAAGGAAGGAGDKKDNSNKPTGASAGLALAGLALAGVAVVATKKSK